MRIEKNGFFAEYFITLHDLEMILADEKMKGYPVRVVINGEYYTLEKEDKNNVDCND